MIIVRVKKIIYNITPKIISFTKKILSYCWRVGGIYMLWIMFHYIASHLYTYFCTPLTFMGFFAAPFLVASPHCYGLRWCIVHGAETITAMWLVIGSWLVSNLICGNN